ncbi:MAG: hypothetical protein HYX90_09225 [Chloroflexi bacterium]|nr:hypothetical protein [Chloroflexota bacterium]
MKLKDGKDYREKLDWLKGTPENPATRRELQDKFRNLATLVLPDGRVEEIIKLVDGLDNLSDVSILARRLVR